MSQEPRPTAESSEQDSVSLHELTDAFARAMGVAPAAEQALSGASLVASGEAAAGVEPADRPGELMSAASEETSEADDPCPIAPTTIFEAMLFVGNRDGQPLTPQQAADLMRGVTPGEVAGLVDQLNRRYTVRGCPYEIASEGSGYRLTLKKELRRLRDQFYGRVREIRLSQAAVDTLAIVAYQQPITAAQINKFRGKLTSHMLSQLVRRGLLRVVREPGGRRPPQYYTTDRFLELFGLVSLADLPQSEELDRL